MNSLTSVYRGFQEGFDDVPGFHLYNLLVDIPGHCAGSTVTAKTLRAAGLEVPSTPILFPKIQREIARLRVELAVEGKS